MHRNLGLAATILGIVQASRALRMRGIGCVTVEVQVQGGMVAGWLSSCPAQLSHQVHACHTVAPCLQLPALRWRPKLTSPYRRLFNIL